MMESLVGGLPTHLETMLVKLDHETLLELGISKYHLRGCPQTAIPAFEICYPYETGMMPIC